MNLPDKKGLARIGSDYGQSLAALGGNYLGALNQAGVANIACNNLYAQRQESAEAQARRECADGLARWYAALRAA